MIAFILVCIAIWLAYRHRTALLAWLNAPLPVTVVEQQPTTTIVIHLHQPTIVLTRTTRDEP